MHLDRKLKLRIYPDSVLRETAFPVKDINIEIHDLIEDMAELMYRHEGIGLAAPQVGILQQIIIADDDGRRLSLINPAIVEEEGEDFLEEGCLSLPGIWVNIRRSSTVLIKYINLEEKEIQREYSGLVARIIKHEIDHLNGIIILDYASTVERFLINKNFKML
ncbi:peptide deformylase [bacterium]|nr:peptide deformylase [bacterium]